MRVGRDEALLVFRGWAEARTWLRVEGRLELLAVAWRLRVVAVFADEVRCAGNDDAELVLRISPTCRFAFADIADLHGTPTKDDLGQFLVVWLTDREGPDADYLGFAAIREKS